MFSPAVLKHPNKISYIKWTILITWGVLFILLLFFFFYNISLYFASLRDAELRKKYLILFEQTKIITDKYISL